MAPLWCCAAYKVSSAEPHQRAPAHAAAPRRAPPKNEWRVHVTRARGCGALALAAAREQSVCVCACVWCACACGSDVCGCIFVRKPHTTPTTRTHMHAHTHTHHDRCSLKGWAPSPRTARRERRRMCRVVCALPLFWERSTHTKHTHTHTRPLPARWQPPRQTKTRARPAQCKQSASAKARPPRRARREPCASGPKKTAGRGGTSRAQQKDEEVLVQAGARPLVPPHLRAQGAAARAW
jgi:hypothetical protein